MKCKVENEDSSACGKAVVQGHLSGHTFGTIGLEKIVNDVLVSSNFSLFLLYMDLFCSIPVFCAHCRPFPSL